VTLAVPIALPQFWVFGLFAFAFFAFVIRAMRGRRAEENGRREARSRVGIVVQSIGIGMAGLGPIRPTLPWASLPAVAGYAAVLLLMGSAVALFASSSATLGKNWSFEARTLDDHQLIRSGPYAHVRHPIYSAMLLFLLGLAAATGHWVQLLLAVPLFLAGTKIRTDAEDRLLEESFGDAFRQYRNGTPALFPKMI
jgi:protein-S-isoprenylcysteine O-methyltransferase Ste14